MSLEHDIRSAEGYFELSMFEEALEEVKNLPEEYRSTPPMLSIAGHSLLTLKRWKQALEIFSLLVQLSPTNPDGYLHAAFCLHELQKTAEAKEMLLVGAIHLKGNAVFYYNLACYECLLGNLDYAEELLEQAMTMDAHFKTSWLSDPDLEPLRERFLK
ncbi:MAG: hypothetical protein SGI98_01260 [Verrucomicrobiota bacterium]|nr:hypothetical protein [Verrucomicrobiota bacterium]